MATDVVHRTTSNTGIGAKFVGMNIFEFRIVNFVKNLRLIYKLMCHFLRIFHSNKVFLGQIHAKNATFSSKCLFSLNFFCTFAF